MKHGKPASWFVTLPLAALAFAYVGLAFFPTEKAIGKMREETAQKQQFCQLTGDLTPLLESARQQAIKTHQFNEAWAKTMPNRFEASAILGAINTMIRTSGARTTRFNPEPILQGQRISQLPLAVGCTGTFPQVFTFLHDLESLPQTVWVREVQIEPKADGQTGHSVSCEVKLAIFLDNSNN